MNICRQLGLLLALMLTFLSSSPSANSQVLVDGERRILVPQIRPLTAIGALEVPGSGHCTAWIASKCHAVTNAHCFYPVDGNKKEVWRKIEAEPVKTAFFVGHDNTKWPVEVVALGKWQEHPARDVALVRFANSQDMEKRFGALEFHATASDKPEDEVKTKGNYCSAGYSVDSALGGFGKKATMDPGTKILATAEEVVNGGSRYMYRLRANSYHGGSGGPVFRCPIDPKTKSPDYSNPIVVAILQHTFPHKSSIVTSSFADIQWARLPGAIAAPIWGNWVRRQMSAHPCP